MAEETIKERLAKIEANTEHISLRLSEIKEVLKEHIIEENSNLTSLRKAVTKNSTIIKIIAVLIGLGLGGSSVYGFVTPNKTIEVQNK